MDKFFSNAFSLGVGIGIGVVIGLLTASKSGEDTRGELKEKIDDMCDIGKEKVGDIVSKAQTLKSEIAKKREQLAGGFEDTDVAEDEE